MSTTYQLHRGTVPLLISMPHNGEQIPDDIAQTMTEKALKVPDTDWYKDKLYAFALEMGAYIIKPEYSRYIIDLNRDPNGTNLYPGANSTELCPTSAFDESPLYLSGQEPDAEEIQHRVKKYWQPYHSALTNTLSEIKQQYGRAVLLDAHSIASRVPRFFEGQLPDFNFGTSDGVTCSEQMIDAVQHIDFAPYSMVTNGRFKGGFITRHYGQPEQNIHSIQLELSQRTYMNEDTATYDEHKAQQVIPKLKQLVSCLINFAEQSDD